MTSGNAQQAQIQAILGSTGCGKSTHLRKCLAKKKRRRTIIWSPKEPIDNYAALYPGSVVCTTTVEVLRILQAAGKSGEFHIVFRPSLVRAKDEGNFHFVCKMALAARNVTFIAEELHTCTRASWAPDGWSELVMMGRGYGVEIFGLSQRPASMDKDFLGNTSTVHVGRLSHPEDAKIVARGLGIKAEEITALSGFQWIERNTNTGKITRG